MPQPGDIVIERLTGKKAMVITASDVAITCRFEDGRLEDRFAFEVEPPPSPPPSLFGSLVSLLPPLTGRDRGAGRASERGRPILVRQSRTA